MYATDGYFPNGKGSKNRISLGLSQIDEEILLKIKEELKTEDEMIEYLENLANKYPLSQLREIIND